MKILIVGSGGREHALAWKASQSPRVKTVYVAPGNAGTAIEDKLTNIDLAVEDIAGLLNFAQQETIRIFIKIREVLI
jgi:phosphoribosylamine--glycine ligase